MVGEFDTEPKIPLGDNDPTGINAPPVPAPLPLPIAPATFTPPPSPPLPEVPAFPPEPQATSSLDFLYTKIPPFVFS